MMENQEGKMRGRGEKGRGRGTNKDDHRKG